MKGMIMKIRSSASLSLRCGLALVAIAASSNCGKPETGPSKPSADATPLPQVAKEIVIGHQADLSGGVSSWGFWLDKAARVAVDEINAKGGIAGRPVKYIAEDTETNPATGVRKLRKLVEAHHADFVIGSVHSGVMMASLPVAEELKTPYFPVGMAAEATAEGSNRYVFRINSHVREQIQASIPWVLNDPSGPKARKWTTFVSDYAWGWSHETWFCKAVTENSGQILDRVRIPQGTKDFLPYLSKIPEDTEALYFVFFGADSLGFIQQLHEVGYRGQKFTVVCTLEAIDIAKLGAAAEGTWVLEYLPRNLRHLPDDPALRATFDHEYHRGFREALGADEDGRDTTSPDRVMACSHCWATYEIVHLIKDTIQRTAWKAPEDTPRFLAALEGWKIAQAAAFPQGDNLIRAEDHQGFHQHWMSRVERGLLQVKFQIPADLVIYPPPVDLRTK